MMQSIFNYFKKRSPVFNNSNRIQFENLWSTHFFVLNLQQLWPKRPNPFWSNMWTFIVIILTAPVCFQLKEIFDSLESVDHFTRIVTVSVNQIFCPFRLISLHMKRNSLLKVRELLKSDYFQPRNKDHMEIFARALNKMYLFCSILASILCGCFFGKEATVLLLSEEKYPLPYDMWIPYDYKKPYIYEFTFIFMILVNIYCCALIASMDLIFLDTVIFIGAQCDMIRYDLEHLEENARNEAAALNKLEDKEFIEKCCMENLKRCIITHQTLLQLHKHVSKTQFVNIIFYFLYHFIITCTSIFQILVSVSISDVNRFIPYFCFILYAFSELLLWSWFGSSLISKSVQISQTLYNLNWMERSKEFNINLRFFMLRTQTPIQFYIFGLAAISLNLYLLMLKWDYAYIQLLNTLSIK